MISNARATTGADAVLRMGAIDPAQIPALIGVLTDAAAGRAPRIISPDGGRPVQRGLPIKCPTCAAEPFDPCRGPSGWATRPHIARQGKRCAHCGDPVTAGRFDYCSPECSQAVKRERDRAYSLAYSRRRRQLAEDDRAREAS
jgi:hypothetical protein